MQPTATEPLSSSVPIDGRLIRRKRQNAGDSLADLAARAGISVSYLSHVERGRRLTVSPAAFMRIRTALGVDDPEELRSDRLQDAA